MILNDGLQAKAFWLYQETLIPVNRKHIDTVIDTPERFNLTIAEIEAVFNSYAEPLHHEGNARRDIMRELFKQGWIRIRDNRKVKSYQGWIFEADSKIRDIWIRGFIEWAILNGNMSKFDRVVVKYLESNSGFDGEPEEF
jgi:hypothetical protein